MKKTYIQISYAFTGKNGAGEAVHPVTMKNRKTGEVGFRVTPPNKGNTVADAINVSEAEMIEYVRDRNYKVRCSTADGRVVSMYRSSSLTFNPSFAR